MRLRVIMPMAAMLIFVAACAREPSSLAPLPAPERLSPLAQDILPPLTIYRPDFLAQVDAEFDQCACPAMKVLIADYRTLRAQLRSANLKLKGNSDVQAQ